MTDAPVAHGRITARLVSFLADGTDEGTTPDEVPLTGKVVLTPTVSLLRMPELETPRTAVIQRLECPIVDGNLCSPSGEVGVWVVATSQPGAEPDTFQWTASFVLAGVAQQPASVTFDVPAGETVDLTLVIPSTPVPGTVTVVSSADRIAAESARYATEALYDSAVAETTAIKQAAITQVSQIRDEAINATSAIRDQAQAIVDGAPKWWTGTQAAYDALAEKRSDTLYLIL